MSSNSLRMPPLREFPRMNALGLSTLALLAKAERVLPEMSRHDSIAWRNARAAMDREQFIVRSEDWDANIRDHLMLEVSGRAGPIAWRETGDIEALGSVRSQALLASGLTSGHVDQFIECCATAFSCLESGSLERRTAEVISGQPTDRPVLFYPRVQDVGTILGLGLSGWSADREPLLLRSIGLYVFFLNAHPFSDGNGRVSRLLLNACLRISGMPPEAVVPIRWMMDASLGGYKVKIRRAVLFEEWEPMIRFICMSIIVTNEVGKSRVKV